MDRQNQTITNIREKEERDSHMSRKNKTIKALSIATAVLALTTTGLAIGTGIASAQANQYKYTLENVYDSNFYTLLDSVNNLENKLSKTLVSNQSEYQRKTLLEASKNASEAEVAVAGLPLSQNDIQDTIKLTNQISGYTATLAESMVEGGGLESKDKASLEKVHKAVVQLKDQLNEFYKQLRDGFSIVDASVDVESSDLTRSLSINQNNNVEYPTMIYDGPFSDSVVNSEVKGLSGEKITKSQASDKISQTMKNATTIDYESQTDGRFKTFNFRVKNSNDEELYVQVSETGGHILTISGAGAEGDVTIDMETAEQIALEFVKNNGIEKAQVVWSDSIGADLYLNIAPFQNDILLYPDLVKVKIDMTSGTIVGYDATTYFTNHTNRTLSRGNLTLSDSKGKVPSTFEVINSRVALIPLDYNREVVCVEVQGAKDGDTYYFYFNTDNGNLENVLKVVETDNGNLLM